MPPLSELPDGITRQKFIRVLKRLGWEISEYGGRGSHYKAVWPYSQKSITIQCSFRKDVLYRILKVIENISGQTWEKDIKDKL